MSTTLQDSLAHPTLDEIRMKVNKETITKQIDEFIEVIASDGFVKFINDVAELPTYSERRQVMGERANLETLRDYGVPIPDGLRISTREFEVPADGKTSTSPLVRVRPGIDPRMGACVSIGWIICASYGD